MNLKKKMKGFFTLTRKANGGFTLVELIVVIAILAILAGVAVPAYSGYITQTNKQADVTLAKDIEHALILGYYEGTVAPGDYVIVYPDKDVKVEGVKTADAMTAAFGASYPTLRLKYSEWDNSVVGVIADYQDSSFSSHEEALLSDVQDLTNAFENFITASGDNFTDVAGEAFDEFLADNNIDATDKQAVSNSLALYAAARTREADEKAFMLAWANESAFYDTFANVAVGEKKLGRVGGLAACYARGEAVVKYVEAKAKAQNLALELTDHLTGKAYTTLSAWFSDQSVDGTDVNTVTGKINGLNENLGYILNTHATYSQFIEEYFYNYAFDSEGLEAARLNSPAAQDAKAYLSILGAIEDSTPALLKDLDSENMYGDGNMKNILNSYIKAGAALKDQGNAIMVQMQENGTAISIPLYNLGLMN